MLVYAEADLLTSPAQTLVNTVNLVGVMGKGLALNFKQVYPEMFKAYQSACETRLIRVGRPWIYRTSRKLILNFPTKSHWRERSRIEDIEAGLRTFVNVYADEGVTSVAFPALGCGNGQLDWNQVRPLMERYLKPLPIPVFIYPPGQETGYPGQLVPPKIKTWLRSEPDVLPLTKVWDDLVRVIRLNHQVVVDTITEPMDNVFHRLKVTDINASIDEALVGALWEEIRTRGVLPKSYVLRELPITGEFLWRHLRALSYVDEIVTYTATRRSEPTVQIRVPATTKNSVPAIALTV